MADKDLYGKVYYVNDKEKEHYEYGQLKDKEQDEKDNYQDDKLKEQDDKLKEQDDKLKEQDEKDNYQDETIKDLKEEIEDLKKNYMVLEPVWDWGKWLWVHLAGHADIHFVCLLIRILFWDFYSLIFIYTCV